MANTYTQIYIQVVFAVRQRECLISRQWREELYRYIAGILRNSGIKLIAIGGMEDHVHILFALPPNIALSDLVRDIKANSSRFISQKGLIRGKFYWQEGFGAFSYSRSQLDAVAKYVLNQEESHASGRSKPSILIFWYGLTWHTMKNICSIGSNRCRSYGAQESNTLVVFLQT